MASNDTRGRRPQPTKLCLLDQVREQAQGSKIRFLGCVHAYHMETGTLMLSIEFPASQTPVPTVAVKLDNVLESVNHELTEIGAWLNIIGIVQPPVKIKRRRRTSGQHRSQRLPAVSATMIWSAGAIKIDQYQQAARAYQDVSATPG